MIPDAGTATVALVGFLPRPDDDVGNLWRFHSRETPLAENHYGGDNRSRYRNPELGVFLDRYFSTVERNVQMQAQGDVVRHMPDQLSVIPLFATATRHW
jgi:hypothetical protein